MISFAAILKLATLNRGTQGGWAANSFFAKDPLSHIFLLLWEERAGKHEFWWENEQLQQFHGLGWFLENLLGMVCFYCPHPATSSDQLTHLCVFTPCSSLVHFMSYNYCCARAYLSRGLLAQPPNRPTSGWSQGFHFKFVRPTFKSVFYFDSEQGLHPNLPCPCECCDHHVSSPSSLTALIMSAVQKEMVSKWKMWLHNTCGYTW